MQLLIKIAAGELGVKEIQGEKTKNALLIMQRKQVLKV